MSDTFAGYIQKKQSKYTAKQAKIEQQQKENQKLDVFFHSLRDVDMELDYEGYKKSEVMEAAKFMLKAQPYGLVAKDLDVSDSPVYYDSRKKSRSWRQRKKLQKAGQRVIDYARKRQKEIAKMAATIKEPVPIEGEWKRNTAFDGAENEDYETSKTVDKLVDTGFVDEVDEMIKDQRAPLSEKDDEFLEAYEQEVRKEVQEDSYGWKHGPSPKLIDQAVAERLSNKEKTKRGIQKYRNKKQDTKLYYIAVDKAVEKELLPYDAFKNEYYKELYEEMGRIKRNKLFTEEERKKKTEELFKKVNDSLENLRRIYNLVAEGKVSPESLKVFLEPSAMTIFPKNLYPLYQKLNYRDDIGNVKNDNDTYADEMQKMIDTQYKSGGSVTDQKTEQQSRKVKDIENFGIFAGKNKIEKGIKTDKRYYITCRPDQHAQMVKAWRASIEKHPTIRDDISFKLGGYAMTHRRDNIVIYLPKGMDQTEEFKTMLAEFKEACGKGVLEYDDKQLPQATHKESEGISTGAEVNMSVYYYTFRPQLYDVELFKRTNKVDFKGWELKTPTTSALSYTQYVTQAGYLAAVMVKNKHKGDDKLKDAKISENEQLLKEYKTYFTDIIRLLGMDPKTMDNENVE